MIRDDILRLCLDASIDFPLLRNAYCDINGLPRGSRARIEVSLEQVAQVVRAAVAAEREACAQVAAGLPENRDWVPGSLWGNIRTEVAAAIRARPAP